MEEPLPQGGLLIRSHNSV